MDDRTDCSSDEESTRSSLSEEISIEELLLPSDNEGSPGVEVLSSKRSRKVPARFKDSACTPSTSRAVEEFEAMMNDSKLILHVVFI